MSITIKSKQFVIFLIIMCILIVGICYVALYKQSQAVVSVASGRLVSIESQNNEGCRLVVKNARGKIHHIELRGKVYDSAGNELEAVNQTNIKGDYEIYDGSFNSVALKSTVEMEDGRSYTDILQSSAITSDLLFEAIPDIAQ